MPSFVSSLAGDLLPGLMLAAVTALAAIPPYLALRQSGRGRARSAVGYLLGFAAGLASTVAAVATLSAEMGPDAIAAAGLLGAFFGPFFGLLRGRQHRKHRPRRRTMAEAFSR
jgi:ABC-type xylose transport system permease subunit